MVLPSKTMIFSDFPLNIAYVNRRSSDTVTAGSILVNCYKSDRILYNAFDERSSIF